MFRASTHPSSTNSQAEEMSLLQYLWRPWKSSRLQFMSDLHLEAANEYSDFQIPATAPYLVLAGDVGRLQDYQNYLRFLQRQCDKFEMVLLVLGNHEFYGLSRSEGLALATKLEGEDILDGKLKILHRRRVDISPSITILGCTLHSHIRPENEDFIGQKVRDFQRIRDWTVQDHNNEHNRDVTWLRNEIRAIRLHEKQLDRRVIVVTHYPPIKRGSCRPEHEENRQSDAFGTELMESDLDLSSVDFWMFGHTHHTTSCSRAGVSLISNQRGYIFTQQTKARKKWQVLFLRRSGQGRFDIKRRVKIMP